ncbi:MAG: hypothetical protein ACXVA9_14035, partial [Bdellovibrionales bacterium]
MFAKIFLVLCFVLPSFTFAETRIGHGPIDADVESAFKKLLSEKNPKAVRARYLDRLLNVRYRTE